MTCAGFADVEPWDDSESLKGPMEVVRLFDRTAEMRDLATQVHNLCAIDLSHSCKESIIFTLHDLL